MRRFAALLALFDETTRANERIDAMVAYFRVTDPADAAWAVHFLNGNRPKRFIPVRKLALWAMELGGISDWLFDECYRAVGDLAETVALLLPPGTADHDVPLHVWIEERLLTLSGMTDEERRTAIVGAWRELTAAERLVWNKLIIGGFRVDVSKQLVVRALAKLSGVDEGVIAHRLGRAWSPTAQSFATLISGDTMDAEMSKPYPFFLAYPLEDELETLGAASEWETEWKWDGIRAQVIRREDETYVWSRGEELITERFPELVFASSFLPNGTVMDGNIMPWKDGTPLPFSQLQRRIGRKTLGDAILSDVPVVLMAYDLLEQEGMDVRYRPLQWRREQLARIISNARTRAIMLSPRVPADNWTDVHSAFQRARSMNAQGLMLKRRSAAYGEGRQRGDWWKWKVQSYAVDAVMIYAEPGQGQRASLHTDYTFGVWSGTTLVPFAKANSGLTDAEIGELDAWIRRNTIEKFGPVRHVRPEHVFELGFVGIESSARHKSGVAVRLPRIVRWRRDKKPDDADTLDMLQTLTAVLSS